MMAAVARRPGRRPRPRGGRGLPPAADLDHPAARREALLPRTTRASRQCTLCSLTSLHFVGDRLVQVSYSEPAGDLIPSADRGRRSRPAARRRRRGPDAGPSVRPARPRWLSLLLGRVLACGLLRRGHRRRQSYVIRRRDGRPGRGRPTAPARGVLRHHPRRTSPRPRRPAGPASWSSTSGARGARPAWPRRPSCRGRHEQRRAGVFVGINFRDDLAFDAGPRIERRFGIPTRPSPDGGRACWPCAATCRRARRRRRWCSTPRAGSRPGRRRWPSTPGRRSSRTSSGEGRRWVSRSTARPPTARCCWRCRSPSLAGLVSFFCPVRDPAAARLPLLRHGLSGGRPATGEAGRRRGRMFAGSSLFVSGSPSCSSLLGAPSAARWACWRTATLTGSWAASYRARPVFTGFLPWLQRECASTRCRPSASPARR